MTPSEGFAALKAGADGLKLFPAEIIPPAVFKAWRAVFPADTLLLAVGGVGVDNIRSYAEAGASGYGIGSALYKPGRPAATSASSPARWSRPQRLDFSPFLPHIAVNEIRASRSANVARGVYCFWGAARREHDDEAEPRQPYPPHLASGPGRRRDALSDPLGRRVGARARTGGRHRQRGCRSQRDRRAWRLLRALSRACGVLRRAEPDRAPGPHQYLAGRRCRAVPAMVGAGAHRLARSVGPSHRGGFSPGDRRRRRHPPEHRDHQGAPHDLRNWTKRSWPGGSRSTARS